MEALWNSDDSIFNNQNGSIVSMENYNFCTDLYVYLKDFFNVHLTFAANSKVYLKTNYFNVHVCCATCLPAIQFIFETNFDEWIIESARDDASATEAAVTAEMTTTAK